MKVRYNVSWAEILVNYGFESQGGSLHVEEWRNARYTVYFAIGGDGFDLSWRDDPYHVTIGSGKGTAEFESEIRRLNLLEAPTFKTPPKLKSLDLPTGDYVNGVPYRLMRLRMIACGTASPTDDEWAEGLGRLLDHLNKYPLSKQEQFCDCEETCKRSGPNFFCPYVPEGVEGHDIKCRLVYKPVERPTGTSY